MVLGRSFYGIVSLPSLVPVSLPIELYVAHVGAEELRNDLVASLDLSFAVVLGVLPSSLADRVPGRQPVLLISEGDSTCTHVIHCSEERIVEHVLQWSELDDRTVVELNHLLAFLLHVDRVHAHTCGETGIGVEPIHLLRAFKVEVRNRWVMSDLLHVDEGTILVSALESLAENWIERLVPHVDRMDEAEGSNDNILHSLDWIGCKVSRCQVERRVNGLGGQEVDH